MLRIGELASYVGITTRAVRFYHQRGLLPEPERTAAGYRLYGADAVLRLSRIVALASAGVPLAHIHDLLDASDEEFAMALVDIDADLRDRIRRLKHDREQLGRLRSGDGLTLPDVIVRLLDHLRAAGVDPGEVDHYRDAWVLSHALYSAQLEPWLDTFGAAMFDDPGYREIMVRTFRIGHLDPDAPEVARIAADSVDWTLEHWDVYQTSWVLDASLVDSVANDLLTSHWADRPAWVRVSELIVEGLRDRVGAHPDA